MDVCVIDPNGIIAREQQDDNEMSPSTLSLRRLNGVTKEDDLDRAF